MGAQKIKKSSGKLDKYINIVKLHATIFIPGAIAAFITLTVLLPSLFRLLSMSSNIHQKENGVVTAIRSNEDLARMKEELGEFKVKVKEFENRLPERTKTTLIIETLQEVTKKSKLKFSSLDPSPIRKHTLQETDDVFVELPVKMKVVCGYFDLIDFLKKIETAEQLMKITDVSIKDNPAQNWEHAIELSISAFSRGDADE